MLRRIFFPALLACLGFPGMPYADTAADKDYLTRLLEDNLSGAGRAVLIEGFAGALSSVASIERLTIADDTGIWITLTGIKLDWTRSALLDGKIEVNALTANEIVLDRWPVDDPGPNLPSPEAAPFALPELPVSIRIASLSADVIRLGAPILGEAVEASLAADMTLAGGEGQAHLALTRLGEGPEGGLDLTASYSNAIGELDLNLNAREGPGGIAVRLLSVPDAPEAALVIAGKGPLDAFAADIALSTDGQDRLSGQITLDGDGAGNRAFAADLSGDLAPLFWPDYRTFLGKSLTLKAQGTSHADGRLDLPTFALDAGSLTMTGHMALAADGLPDAFGFDLDLRSPAGTASVLLPLSTEIETRLTSAHLYLSFDAAKGRHWTATGNMVGLDRADFRADQLDLSGGGMIDRQGDARRVSADLDFMARGLLATDPALAQALGTVVNGSLQASWLEGEEGTRIRNLSVTGQDYDFRAIATVDGLSTGFQTKGLISGTWRDLARLSGLSGLDLKGEAKATLAGTADLLGGGFDLSLMAEGTDLGIGLAEVDGVLRGQSSLTIDVRRDITGTEIKRADIKAPDLVASLSGRLTGAGAAITAVLDLPRVAALGPAYGGRLFGTVGLDGTMTDAELTLDAEAEDLSVGQAQIDGLLAGQSRLSVAAQLQGDSLQITQATVTAPAASARVVGRLNADNSDITADLALGSVSALDPRYRGRAEGTLRFAGSLVDGQIGFSGTAENLASGQPEIDRIIAGTSLIETDVALVNGLPVLSRVRLDGGQLDFLAKGSADSAALEVTGRLSNLGLLVPQFPGMVSLTGSMVPGLNGSSVDLMLTGPAGINGRLTGQLGPDYQSGDLAFRGQAAAALANPFLKPRALSGQLDFDLASSGPLAIGSLTGLISLSGGTLADPAQNFTLKDIGADARLSNGRAAIAARTSVSTGGTVDVTGDVGLALPFPGALRIRVDSVGLRQSNLYDTSLSGSLTMEGPLLGGALISGRLDMGRTELRIPSTGLSSAVPIPDIRHLHEPGEVRATRERAGLFEATAEMAASAGTGLYPLDITLSAPNQVFLRGRGLDTELAGSLRLRGTSGDIQPAGSFDLLRGRFNLLGRRLNLEVAQVLMQGTLIPRIDIVATTEVDGTYAQMRISGPADAPDVTFSSDPDLPDEEVLAQLVFGERIETLSAFQAAQLAAAIATLVGKGGEGLSERIREKTTLDNLDLRTNDAGDVQVTAGKYLSDKVYSEVTVDQKGKTTINLNLDVRPHVTLKARTDTDGESGLGLYLEKNY